MNERLQILTRVYDDWAALRILIARIDEALASKGMTSELIVVDDGSPERPAKLVETPLRAITAIRIVALRGKLGQQRAIATGLAYAHAELQPDAVLVMDDSGEDDPLDVPRLIEKCREENFSRIVFARRVKRSEGRVFRMFYGLFWMVYRFATGTTIRVGNFSIVPRPSLERLVNVTEIWNHYVAGTLVARLPYTTIDTNRAKRYTGQSQKVDIELITQGLSAISVHSERVGVRMLIALLSLLGVTTIAGVAALFAGYAWVKQPLIIAIAVLLPIIAVNTFFVFIILGRRSAAQFVPSRDSRHFVREVTLI